jgi:hypothetical protein
MLRKTKEAAKNFLVKMATGGVLELSNKTIFGSFSSLPHNKPHTKPKV